MLVMANDKSVDTHLFLLTQMAKKPAHPGSSHKPNLNTAVTRFDKPSMIHQH